MSETARNRMLSLHGEVHEVTGVARDGIRQVLRRFPDHDVAWAWSRQRQANFTDLRVQTITQRDGPVSYGDPKIEADNCGTCRNKLLWAGEAHCTVDDKRHRLAFSCRHYTDMSPA